MRITVWHSPDADDRLMFWPLQAGLVETPYEWTFQEANTQSLNELALAGEADVMAISAAHYPAVANYYQPLVMGCSVGDGYGPVLIAARGRRLDTVRRVGVPGLQTTAYAVLRCLIGPFEPVVVPITPMERVFDVLKDGLVSAALLIHEGRLIYDQWGYVKLLDLGEAWEGPLPLGMNVIRRTLPEATRQDVSSWLVRSCQVALKERETFVQAYGGPLGAIKLRQYLDMYANEATLRAGERERAAFTHLYEKMNEHGLLAAVPALDWL